jgi:hypothetical protein
VFLFNAPGCDLVLLTALQTQSATVNKQAPKGCVARSIESGDFVLPDASCLNELVLNVTNTTGVDCDEAATSVAVGFKNVTGCMEGKIGTANLTALKAGKCCVPCFMSEQQTVLLAQLTRQEQCCFHLNN